MMVESQGDLYAVGDGGRAIGPYQIHKVAWIDAAQYDQSLKDSGHGYKNCMGQGSKEYSERVMQVGNAYGGSLVCQLRTITCTLLEFS
jgi:hypothetical protein